MRTTTVIPEYGRAASLKLRRLLGITVKSVLTLSMVAGIACGTWWWAVVRPYWRLQAMLETPAAQARSPAEFRAAAHAALRFPGLDPHDAYLVLRDHGDASTVPVLIRSLQWQPHTSPHEPIICTKAHCLEALRKLTGRDLGVNYEDWSPLLDAMPTTRPS